MRIAVLGVFSKEVPGQVPDTAAGALYYGLRESGHKVIAGNPRMYKAGEIDRQSDLVLVHGSRSGSWRAAEDYRAFGTPVIVFEGAPLRFLDKGVSWAGLYSQWTGNIADEPNASNARWKLLPKIEAQVPGRPPSGNHILILGQLPVGNAALGQAHYWQWVRDRLTYWVSQDTDVQFRPHPQTNAGDVPADIVPWVAPESTLRDALSKCLAVDTYNSSAEYEALYYGVPTMHVGDEGIEIRKHRLYTAAWQTWSYRELREGPDAALAPLLTGIPIAGPDEKEEVPVVPEVVVEEKKEPDVPKGAPVPPRKARRIAVRGK